MHHSIFIKKTDGLTVSVKDNIEDVYEFAYNDGIYPYAFINKNGMVYTPLDVIMRHAITGENDFMLIQNITASFNFLEKLKNAVTEEITDFVTCHINPDSDSVYIRKYFNMVQRLYEQQKKLQKYNNKYMQILIEATMRLQYDSEFARKFIDFYENSFEQEYTMLFRAGFPNEIGYKIVEYERYWLQNRKI